jgi:GNAT superfamily N-acetyltransferase
VAIDDIYIINNIRIVPLTNDHNLEPFCCGNNEIDHFLKNSAIAEQEEMLSRTYLICINNDVIGFFTLSASSIEVLAVDAIDGIEEFSESIYPAIDLSKLAVTKKFQGKGIGEYTLKAAIGKILSVSEHIGCRYIILDSMNDKVGFYRKYDFKIVDIYKNDEYIKMYLNMIHIYTAFK